MGKSTKLGITISLLSVLVIGGSVYYYNDSLSKSSEKLQQTSVTTTVTTTTEAKLKQSKENVKITTEVKDEKVAVVTIENISDRTLTDVVVESNFKGIKNAEVLITNLDKGGKKKLEVPLENKLNAASIKENIELSSGFRMLERAEFSVGENKGEIIVSTLKSQTKEFYIEKVKASDLDQSQKEELIKKIDTAKNIEDIEKLLRENKIITEVKLSDEHVTFKEGENELKIEATSVSETTSSIEQTEQEISTNSVVNNQAATPAVLNGANNVSNTVSTVRRGTTSGTTNAQSGTTTGAGSQTGTSDASTNVQGGATTGIGSQTGTSGASTNVQGGATTGAGSQTGASGAQGGGSTATGVDPQTGGNTP